MALSVTASPSSWVRSAGSTSTAVESESASSCKRLPARDKNQIVIAVCQLPRIGSANAARRAGNQGYRGVVRRPLSLTGNLRLFRRLIRLANILYAPGTPAGSSRNHEKCSEV